ncbi:MAG: DUF362 domain-containing protein [Candidatus Methanomethylicia archaeon]
MKVGVIGCGSVLKRFHLPAVRKIPEIEVKALADINEKRIKEIINKFNLINVEEYTDYRHLLKNADIDAVWILTPPKFHAKMIVEALNHGKHVLCEKPIATCIDEIEMINEVLKRNSIFENLIIMPSHNYIFTPCFEKAVEYVKSGLIGEVREVYGKVVTNLLLYKPATDFRFQTTSGVIEDLLVHAIYLSQDLCGLITKVNSVKPKFNNKAIIEKVEVDVTFENGVRGILSSAWSNRIPTFKFDVKGDLGSISMNIFNSPYKLMVKKGEEKKTIYVGYRFTQYFKILNHPSFFREHMHFINLINGYEKPRISIEDGFKTVKALSMIVNSIEGGMSIREVSHREKVAIVKVDGDIQGAIRKSIELLGGLNIQRNAKVVIKPNVCLWKNTDGMIITDPRILEAVLKIVRKYTDKIIVVESDNNSGSAEKRVKKSGIMEIIEKNNAEFINLSRDESEEHEVAGFKIHIPKTVLNADYFINIPKIKTCNVKNLVISIAMKNMFGILSDKKKMALHEKLMDIILYINKIVKQDLIIVDGIIGMEGLGPVLGKPVNLNLIVSGLNPVTVDAVCCKIMEINPYAVEILWKAYKMGMGEIDMEKIDVLGENIENVKRKFARPTIMMENVIGAIKAALRTYIG